MPNDPALPSGPGRPKDLVKREAILQAAKVLFLSNGYSGTSMDAVAAQAGVSKLTVYGHFTDKETLFSAAVIATCQAQLPEVLFDPPQGAPIKEVLLDIGRGFHALISSQESVNLHRLIIALGSQDPKLCQIFFEAGPLPLLKEMERLLKRMNQNGGLAIQDPHLAAEHFFSLLKGAPHFRLLLGCSEPLDEVAIERHVGAVVELFVRAYRPDQEPEPRST
ncbi:MAG: TetR/AcrR family transcriptional regulator [Pseudomonas sp.]|uniref:TetR/AcrR family transcriptional regulator n=1 Tax=Pseudomonas abieticivorans TaxID=2931382 RepID=UPI0020BFF603|nr:TetR/AcrR family transcriptional regulator [Pseudomonas sp. PIA16]MDE1166014.1 TetR/AcrR family transcriptional regulator [Pseudomonas sp.]